MGLGLPTAGDGNFVPYLKYDAKAGRWFIKDDAGNIVEVQQMTAVFDLGKILTGLLAFQSGQAPTFIGDSGLATGDAVNPNNGVKFTRGFKVLAFAESAFVGVREFSSNAGLCNDAMNMLFDAYEAAPEKASGQCPVVSCTGVTPKGSGEKTNYQPTLEIVGWTARPTAFDEAVSGNAGPPAPPPHGNAAPPPAPPPAPPAQQAAPPAPPAPPAAPAAPPGNAQF